MEVVDLIHGPGLDERTSLGMSFDSTYYACRKYSMVNILRQWKQHKVVSLGIRLRNGCSVSLGMKNLAQICTGLAEFACLLMLN